MKEPSVKGGSQSVYTSCSSFHNGRHCEIFIGNPFYNLVLAQEALQTPYKCPMGINIDENHQIYLVLVGFIPKLMEFLHFGLISENPTPVSLALKPQPLDGN